MKKLLPLLLCALLLTGCGAPPAAGNSPSEAPTLPADYTYAPLLSPASEDIPFITQFPDETRIHLSDNGISVNGGRETDTVFTSHDIIYYEDRDTYPSGKPYGEGEAEDKHTAAEAAAHTVVNITAPGTYRVSGTLSAGQIRINLGEDAREDPSARVELILEDANITCTVAPAILFLNVYECDGSWSTDTARPEVDTSAAGANLILEGRNTITGSHVAKIFKDKEGEKKLWKQDGAIYSYMSMNVYGPGSLDLTADNEGLDTELHLTIFGGSISIRSGNDGINTNEDGVSVTTINGGSVHIIAGLGKEGDGIDSNGYLVINGGIVVSSANPASDAGLDSDLGSFIHGGTVIALGSTMDWAESDSRQVTMNLQFASMQSVGSALTVTRPDGTVIFAYDPGEDEVLGGNQRQYMGAVISCANFIQGESYSVYLGGTLTGSETGGVYDPATITAHTGGIRMGYTGTDVTMGPGGAGGFGGGRPGGREDFTPPDSNFTIPEGDVPSAPGGDAPPMDGPGNMGGFGNRPDVGNSGGNTLFYMQDKVNFFSGLTPAEIS